MLRAAILSRLAKTIIFLALINVPATLFYWYSLEWWFDMPMHFLGGVSVFFIAAVLWLPARKWVSDTRYIYECLITALLFGVLWEALELYLHVHYGSPEFFLTDSLSDVFFDMAGALAAALSLMPLLRKSATIR